MFYYDIQVKRMRITILLFLAVTLIYQISGGKTDLKRETHLKIFSIQ